MSYIINNIEFTIIKEQNHLIIKAVNFKTFVEYEYIITNEIIKDCNLISSLNDLLEMLHESFNNYYKLFSVNNSIYIEIQECEKNNLICINFFVKFRQMENKLIFKLKSIQENTNEQLSNKIDILNKKFEKVFELIDELQRNINLSEK